MKFTMKFEGRRLSPLDSIRQYCLWCCGSSPKEVASCPANTCSFFQYRFGTIPPGAPRNLVNVIKRKCADCLPQGAAEFDAYKRHFQSPCPNWPYRMGCNPNYGVEQRKKLQTQGKGKGFGAGSQTCSASTIHPGGEDDPKVGWAV